MSFARKGKKGYYGLAIYYDADGKRKQKSVGCYKTKREALKEADKKERELEQININLKDITLADYYKRWYDLYKGSSMLSDISKKRYLIFHKTIKSYFKNTKMREIKRTDYQLFINWYGESHGYSSTSKLNGAVRQCVSYAIDDDIIIKDFTNNVVLNYNKSHKKNVEYLSIKETTILKNAVIEGLNKYNTSRFMILTAIYTGMRKEEIQALTWNDIDEIHGTINISKAWDESKKDFKATKTNTSNRTIKVNRELLKYLDVLKSNNSTMIFRNVFGTIPTSTALNKCLRSIMHDAGIEKQDFHFHSLRHVHVAYLLSKGVDIYAISKRLGHSNVTITLNTYSYLIDELKAKNDNLITEKLAKL